MHSFFCVLSLLSCVSSLGVRDFSTVPALAVSRRNLAGSRQHDLKRCFLMFPFETKEACG